ncbi:hypothetical protein BDV25DRAFT_142670 [Aspergillus avenaceus]|uniref:DUF7730 domain-containing protein n=1 Tax=Aspergillus avenaceus TaxID=36643 RepID=A0A5N6TMF3_ASPAV|nr:hypothetical protein BDV25DRAFT_142670 [Aspergillus avenaceus]
MRNKLIICEDKIRHKAIPAILKVFRPKPVLSEPQYKRTSLLELPSEVRLLIYLFIFETSCDHILVKVDRNKRVSRSQIDEDGQDIKPPPGLSYSRTPSVPLSASLLQTNQKIYHEALPILYARVIFSASSNPTSLMYFTDRMSEFARNNIRQIQLYPVPLLSECFIRERDLLSWNVICAAVAELPGLRRLIISYPRPESLEQSTVEFHRSHYAKWLKLVQAEKSLVFDEFEEGSGDMERYRERFRKIMEYTDDMSEN